jgi:hypothetical protein
MFRDSVQNAPRAGTLMLRLPMARRHIGSLRPDFSRHRNHCHVGSRVGLIRRIFVLHRSEPEVRPCRRVHRVPTCATHRFGEQYNRMSDQKKAVGVAGGS